MEWWSFVLGAFLVFSWVGIFIIGMAVGFTISDNWPKEEAVSHETE